MDIENVALIDRLTFVGFKIDYKIEQYLNDPFNMYVKKRYRANNYPYSWTYELMDGILQIGDVEGRTNMRLDFNPSNLSYPKELIKIIECMKYVKCSRVDVAIDIKGLNINDYTVIDNMSRKTNKWFSGLGVLETLYIGAPTSDLRLRIYDKAKEQGKKGDWWRFESQLRGNFISNLSVFNPFDSIELVPNFINLNHIESLKEKVFIQYLCDNPNELNKLAKRTRLRYKKILSELADSDSKQKINISHIYANNIKKIINQIEKLISHSYSNNVITN